MPAAAKYADAIDGTDGSWSLPLAEDDGTLLEPLSGLGYSLEQARVVRLVDKPEKVFRRAYFGSGVEGGR